MRGVVAALALVAFAFTAEPLSARVLGDATVAYSAERVLTVNGQSFPGRIFSIPGHQRHEQSIGGFQQVAIFDLVEAHGYFILPALMSYVDFRISGPIAELSAPDITGAPAGTETVSGVATAKYKVSKRASDGTLIEGMIWLTGAGIPIRAEGAVTLGQVLHVSPIACDGRGLCAEIAPELIVLDDWGFPIIAPDPVPVGLLPEAEAAVRICPVLALGLTATDTQGTRPVGRQRAGQLN